MDDWLDIMSYVRGGTNTLIIFDDYTIFRDVLKKTGELLYLAFSARHEGISVWVLSQQVVSIVNAIRENITSFVLFHTLANNMNNIFESYAGKLMNDENKKNIAKLKSEDNSHLIFTLHPLKWK